MTHNINMRTTENLPSNKDSRILRDRLTSAKKEVVKTKGHDKASKDGKDKRFQSTKPEKDECENEDVSRCACNI